ncbi:MAG: hypothetical protein LBL42_05345 [Tannerella sp.]|jgi:hypothetical protein|nr:hypothetical protein [Tannerella sp.]
MEQSDYFAEFRPVFNQIVQEQEADSELQLIHFRFRAPVEEVAQMAKLARIFIDAGPGENSEHLPFVHFITFIIKMFEGIIDKSVDPLQLDFTATEQELEHAVIAFEEIIKARLESSDNRYANEWADTLILINAFVKRLEKFNHSKIQSFKDSGANKGNC